MTTRPTPAAAEIYAALTDPGTYRHLTDERLVPWEEALTTVRAVLRTTRARASEWLRDAALDPDSGLIITWVRRYGAIHGVGRWGEDSNLMSVSLKEAGFIGRTEWTHIGHDGRYQPSGKRDDAPGSDNGETWIGTRVALQNLLTREDDEAAKRHLMFEVDDIVEAAAFDHEHPSARATVRGMFEAAGIHERRNAAEIDVHATQRSKHGVVTRMKIELSGPEIEHLVQFLHRIGIQPKGE